MMSEINTILTKNIKVKVHNIQYNKVHKKFETTVFVYGVPDEPQVLRLREGDDLTLEFPLTLSGKVA